MPLAAGQQVPTTAATVIANLELPVRRLTSGVANSPRKPWPLRGCDLAVEWQSFVVLGARWRVADEQRRSHEARPGECGPARRPLPRLFVVDEPSENEGGHAGQTQSERVHPAMGPQGQVANPVAGRRDIRPEGVRDGDHHEQLRVGVREGLYRVHRRLELDRALCDTRNGDHL